MMLYDVSYTSALEIMVKEFHTKLHFKKSDILQLPSYHSLVGNTVKEVRNDKGPISNCLKQNLISRYI